MKKSFKNSLFSALLYGYKNAAYDVHELIENMTNELAEYKKAAELKESILLDMQERDEEFAAAAEERELAANEKGSRFTRLPDAIAKYYRPDEIYELKTGTEIRTKSFDDQPGHRKVFFRGSTPDHLWDWENSGWQPAKDEGELDPLKWGSFSQVSELGCGDTLDTILYGKSMGEELGCFYDGAHCFLVGMDTNSEQEKAGKVLDELRKNGRKAENIYKATTSLVLVNDRPLNVFEDVIRGVLNDVYYYGLSDPAEDDKLDRALQRGKYGRSMDERYNDLMAAGKEH